MDVKKEKIGKTEMLVFRENGKVVESMHAKLVKPGNWTRGEFVTDRCINHDHGDLKFSKKIANALDKYFSGNFFKQCKPIKKQVAK